MYTPVSSLHSAPVQAVFDSSQVKENVTAEFEFVGCFAFIFAKKDVARGL